MATLTTLRQTKSLLVLLSLAVGTLSSAAEVLTPAGSALARLSDGPPVLEKELNADAFTTYTAEKLAHAQAWYVDYEYFRKMGVAIPKDGLRDPAFAKAIVDAFGWQSRGMYDEDHSFTHERKTRYTDYYGGYGMGTNLGSGRAGMNGYLQSKGEITPLAKSDDPFHSNGAVQSIEAVDEAIWSQVLDHELKVGSNKVVAVILTGTYAKVKSGQFFPRALIIRETALRPAHFMMNHSLPKEQELARVRALMPQLLNALPYPATGRPKNNREALKVGIMQLVDLEAQAEAEYFAKRMFFGSVTPSNLEITGRRLDLGDHTANPGFSKIYRLDWQSETPFGEIKEFLNLFSDFQQSLARSLPENLRTALPSAKEIHERFANAYNDSRAKEMVLLTGVPVEIASALETTNEARVLGKILITIARDGNTETVFMEHSGWENKGTYDLGAILTRLAKSPEAALKGDASILADLMKDNAPLRAELASAYAAYAKVARRQARSMRVRDASLNTYMAEAVQLRNASRPNLVRGDRRWKELWETTDKAINEHNPSIVENYIKDQSSQAIFTFKDAAPFQLVLKEEKDSLEGVTKRRVFDARRNEFATVVRLQVANGRVALNGQDVSLNEVAKIGLDLGGGEATVRAEGKLSGDWMEFSFRDHKDINLAEAKLVANPTSLNVTRASKDAVRELGMSRRSMPQTCKALF